MITRSRGSVLPVSRRRRSRLRLGTAARALAYDARVRNEPVWNDAPRSPSAPLQGDVRADVCVIGLGGSGLTAVNELLRHGLDVVALDAGEVASGAAGRNGGFLLAGTAAFHHDAISALGHERALMIYERTRQEITRILRETPTAVRRTGSLRIAVSDDEQRDCDLQLAAMQCDALPAEAYEGPEGRGILFPEDAVMDPMARCRALAARAAAGGARVFEHSEALNVRGTEVRARDGTVHCQGVIVAVDGKLERILPELAGRVRTARLQMLATAPTDEVRVPRPVYLRHGFEYYQQTPDGRIALGGFRDQAGDAEWTDSSEPTADVQAKLERYLREHIGVRAPITHRWAASVGYTPGILPLFGEVRPGVWALGGYNGTGNVIGAILGRAAAQHLVEGGSELSTGFLESETPDRRDGVD